MLDLINIRRFGKHRQMSWRVELMSHPYLILMNIADIVDGLIGLLSLGMLHSSFGYELSYRLAKKRAKWVRKYPKERQA